MPQIKTLDRHVVTVAERIKAKAVAEGEYNLTQGTKKAAKVIDKGPVLPKRSKDGFSKGENDLYREYGQIQDRLKQEELEA